MPTPVPERARAVPLPTEVRVAPLYKGAFLADAYAIALPACTTHDITQLARFAFEQQAPWVDGLMGVRDAVMGTLGLKTASDLRATASSAAPRVGIFRIYETLADEIVLGEDDGHLDFRVSVHRRPASAGVPQQLTVVTVVHCHNLLGRNYIRVIGPIHKRVVRSALDRAAQNGWPTA